MKELLKRLPAVSRFTWFRYNYLIPILAVIPIFLVYLFYNKFYEHIGIWNRYLSPFLSITGTLSPLVIWLYFLNKEWEQHLPHKLVVHFFMREGEGSKKYIMSYYNSSILPDADIRSLGQQLGSQIADGDRDLKFSPSIYIVANNKVLQIRNSDGKMEWIRYSEVEFWMKSLPKSKSICEKKQYHVANITGYEEAIISVGDFPSTPFHGLPDKMELRDLLASSQDSIDKFKTLGQLKNVNEDSMDTKKSDSSSSGKQASFTFFYDLDGKRGSFDMKFSLSGEKEKAAEVKPGEVSKNAPLVEAENSSPGNNESEVTEMKDGTTTGTEDPSTVDPGPKSA